MTQKSPEIDDNQIHIRNGRRAIVMFSGGHDSTVALWWAMNRYHEVKAITVDYNQPHRQEIECARCIADLIGLEHDVIKVDFPEHYWGIQNFLTRGQAVLMVAIAALDIGRDGADIILGTLRTDPFRDSNRVFLDALAYTMRDESGDLGEIGIVTPLHALKDKAAVAAMGYQLGAPIHMSWSCRHPSNGLPCQDCVACRQRNNIAEKLSDEYGITEDNLNTWLRFFGSPYHPSFENSSNQLKVLASAFVQAGGIKEGVAGWQYRSPDGTERIASLIRKPPQQLMDEKFGRVVNHIRAHGFFADGSLWEICVCADGSVAATERLPDIDILKRELIKRVDV